MANVGGISGFTQLTKLNVTELLYLRGKALAGANTVVNVQLDC